MDMSLYPIPLAAGSENPVIQVENQAGYRKRLLFFLQRKDFSMAVIDIIL